MNRILLAAFVYLLAAGSTVAAGKWTPLGFVCAKPGLPPDVRRIVAELMAKQQTEGLERWGDRAVPLQLRRDSSLAYFVPLSCASGNCTWAIVGGSPARTLGIASAAFISTEIGGSEWPDIILFTKSSEGVGQAEVLTFSGDGYQSSKRAQT